MKKMITTGVEKLSKADYVPQVTFVRKANGKTTSELNVFRNGHLKSYSISNKVAAELIAAGFGYGE